MPTAAELDLGLTRLNDAENALKTARSLANNAHDAALHCDALRATRLKARAALAAADVSTILASIPADVLDFYARDDVIRRILRWVRDMLARINPILKTCGASASALNYVYKRGGSFDKTTTPPSKSNLFGTATIKWVFELSGDPKCECLCLVSVFSLEREATGELVGMNEGFADPDSVGLGLGLPHEGGGVDGYAVDAGVRKFGEKPKPHYPLVARHCPCDLTQKASPKAKPKRITGHDHPSVALAPGIRQHFETALVCLDRRPYRVLGSMRWRRDGPDLVIEKRRGRVNWGDASAPFKRALDDWMRRFGQFCCTDLNSAAVGLGGTAGAALGGDR